MSDNATLDKSPVKRQIHPGSGRRKPPVFAKGRQLNPGAQETIHTLLGNRSRQRDLLIEHLHLIQDTFGCLSADHMQALADEMKLPMAEVYEVASFYAHFDIVLDGETAPAEITVRVCESLSCEMAGADELLGKLPAAVAKNVRVVKAPCMGRCDCAPVAEVGHNHVEHATVEKIVQVANAKDLEPAKVPYRDYDAYIADGGYKVLRECYEGKYERDQIVELLKNTGLRGLGGAGFPTGLKWGIIRQQPKPRLMAINGDEGEPGTFKDRHYLETDPHRFLEGMLIGAWVGEVEASYIYIRDEYPAVIKLLKKEIDRLYAEGLNNGVKIDLRRGAGAYICGEESAMIESIEGKRGLPRHKPPFPSQVGLFGLPTLTNNVETVYWVRDLIEKGPEWFTSEGRNGRKGLRSFSVSGRVKNPGVKFAPAGITIKELIAEYCDGMAEGHEFKAYLPGGASGGILPASLGDVPLDFDTLQAHGCFIGSAAIVVLSDQDKMRDVASNLMRFFEDESCGQCTPCRNGTEKAVKLMQEETWDQELLKELSTVMMDASICGLGQAAPNPLLSVMKHFPEEL
ncbi:NAD(P)H-dependent oxidoreductase subunit E [Kiloniella laminariae]|uniref:NAD(P)H-dependent oxidoreductase subunit E n=1 Tax=Kiloniella laminariae TaxID=454162 RepID=A0ABT4LHH7_9PROT|nr:NAD(P)H-dependent oxidoreductase subunit E [Kiloniella laminariae]MCZ4280544.1 NAD(P)H-dependent oxidoreductase subunit E [Kiloniella laminariae]